MALEIYEIGGGYGTNALCILEFLRREAPAVYARTRYRIVEISGWVLWLLEWVGWLVVVGWLWLVGCGCWLVG